MERVRGGGLTVVSRATAGEFAWFQNVLGSLDIDEEVKRTDVRTMSLVDSGDVVSGLIGRKGESEKEKIAHEREKERGPRFLDDLMIRCSFARPGDGIYTFVIRTSVLRMIVSKIKKKNRKYCSRRQSRTAM